MLRACLREFAFNFRSQAENKILISVEHRSRYDALVSRSLASKAPATRKERTYKADIHGQKLYKWGETRDYSPFNKPGQILKCKNIIWVSLSCSIADVDHYARVCLLMVAWFQDLFASGAVAENYGPAVLSNSSRGKQALESCNHKEADTHIMVHISDAAAQGHTKITVRTVDTDVVVLAISFVSQLPQLEELCVHIGTGKNHQFLPCHAIAASLGSEKAEVLPLFNAFTGCDSVSSFAGKGKKALSKLGVLTQLQQRDLNTLKKEM